VDHARALSEEEGVKYGFFFVATLAAVAALFFVVGGVATGILALGVAELLIRRARFTETGVESALWLGGLVALIAALPSRGQPEAILVFAAAAAIASARVRNPWFGALAAVLVLFYLQEKGVGNLVIAAAGQAMAIVAALARARTWRLASTDRLFGAIAIAAPLKVYRDVWPVDLAGGAVVLALGLRLRDRMLLIAGAISIAIGVVDVSRRFDYLVEWKLIAAGVALVALSVAIARALRGRTSGIVVTPVPKTKYEEAATIAATVLLQPQHAAPAESSRFEGAGGDGGGAGTTESF
jgi:hypothetical protein